MATSSLPPLPKSSALTTISNNDPPSSDSNKDGQATTATTNTFKTTSSANLLPSSKAQAYVAIFEDALDQLSVLGDITPEIMKTDNKLVTHYDNRTKRTC
jgi:hypothetical protein